MLRDDKDFLLNEVLIGCIKAADHYAQAAELADEPKLIDMFQRLTKVRRRDARRIEKQVRELGYLPDAPQGDKQDFSRLITRARSAVSGGSARLLIQKAVDFEKELGDKVDGARRKEWKPNVADLLREIGEASRINRKEMNTC